jgi:hypothetical protein
VGSVYSGEYGRNTAESPEKFIRNMFQEHLSQYDNVFWFDNEAILSKYFDKELTALFLEDRKCYEWTDELCSLDFDPIIDAQDYDEKRPTKVEVTIEHSNDVIKAIVTFDNIQPRKIIFVISITPKGFRIADILVRNGKYSIKKILMENIKESNKLKSNYRLKLTARLC